MKTCLGILSEPRENGFVNRDMLFYMLNELSPEYFSSQSQVNRTIQDVVALLRCSPYNLRILESCRGRVAGLIRLEVPKALSVDCSRYKERYSIPSDLNFLDILSMKERNI